MCAGTLEAGTMRGHAQNSGQVPALAQQRARADLKPATVGTTQRHEPPVPRSAHARASCALKPQGGP
eukprot:8199955-Alexandrium_andersonii.AAC.1